MKAERRQFCAKKTSVDARLGLADHHILITTALLASGAQLAGSVTAAHTGEFGIMPPTAVTSTRIVNVPRGCVRAVVVAPTFNNAGTLENILTRVRALGLPIVVVNDGSTDSTRQILGHWQARSQVTVLCHDRNSGKAMALQTGFAAARAAGFTHAVTIDTDGQHDPEQIPQLLETAVNHPEAIILGRRDRHANGYPARSRMGRALSNLMIRLESGVRVADSQCGLRIYPLDQTLGISCRAGRYGFETEILTRAAWAGVPIVQVDVNCHYLPKDQRVSHFRPVVDTLRGAAMHGRLMMGALPRWAIRLAGWLSPVQALRKLQHQPGARSEFAAGLAVGVFIACLPVYGIQSVLSLFAARRLNLHPIWVLAGSQLSIPPISPILIWISLTLGHLLLHGTLSSPIDWSTAETAFLSTALWRAWLLEWVVGGLLLGLVLALATYGIARALFLLAPRPQIAPTQIPA